MIIFMIVSLHVQSCIRVEVKGDTIKGVGARVLVFIVMTVQRLAGSVGILPQENFYILNKGLP